MSYYGESEDFDLCKTKILALLVRLHGQIKTSLTMVTIRQLKTEI